ncbi:hypothetical protein N7463_003627 [Penicillium fimorum]|uniref:Uncharacterized protein n=1 Tax=Penicillium fimorum TaxID=1882269 RepID=A0A9W9Y254_9EURO|nr:hypothetical protein N7463_003627 [Penicillium fimorum]
MHFYPNFLTLLAFGATLTAAQTRGGTCSKSTQLCTLTSGSLSALLAVLACPAHSQIDKNRVVYL